MRQLTQKHELMSLTYVIANQTSINVFNLGVLYNSVKLTENADVDKRRFFVLSSQEGEGLLSNSRSEIRFHYPVL